MISYNLNPDFRRKAPETGNYCACCQKPIRGKAIPITVNWENWEVVEGHGVNLPIRKTSGKTIDAGYVGSVCWKKVKTRLFLCA